VWKAASITNEEGDPVDEKLGAQFAVALADKDAVRLKALLRPDVDFRAMTPDKFWESTDADFIVDETILGRWFAPERRIIETLGVESGRVGTRDRVSYRFKVEQPDGEYVIEQQAYFETDGDRISWLRIMCSGYLPSSSS
jgi:hypothetical protein